MRGFLCTTMILCGTALATSACGGDDSPTSPGTDFSCPTPAGGKITVCGQIADVENDDSLQAAGATGAPCDPTPSANGPCSVQINFYDAAAFAANPAAATPIAPATLYLDDRGRFRAEDLTPPAGVSLAIALDDAVGTTDRHRLTGSSRRSSSGHSIRSARMSRAARPTPPGPPPPASPDRHSRISA